MLMEEAVDLPVFARPPSTALQHGGQVLKEAQCSSVLQQPPHILVTK